MSNRMRISNNNLIQIVLYAYGGVQNLVKDLKTIKKLNLCFATESKQVIYWQPG